MKLEFINHASILLEHKGLRLICDPWLEGSVFNKGWKHIAKSQFSYEDFATINYIWFSHEHPDHFFPPNLKKIKPEFRQHITILFQETIDKRVVEFCKEAGFKGIIELKPDTWHKLAEDWEILCENFEEGDSWACFRTPKLNYLNANDCTIENNEHGRLIRQKVGKIDVLLTQFSYAYWAGNKADTEYRKSVAAQKLKYLKDQATLFEPRKIIPFASYVWFCHEENYYLNDLVNQPDFINTFIQKETQAEPLFLYVNDVFEFEKPHNSELSLKKWQADYQKIFDNPELNKTEKVPLEKLLAQSQIFLDNLKKTNNNLILKLFLKPTYLYLTDYQYAMRLSFEGLEKTDRLEKDCDVALASDSVLYCFSFPYGQDTLGVNGRFQKPENNNYKNFYNFFRFWHLQSRGQQVDWAYLAGVAWRRIFG